MIMIKRLVPAALSVLVFASCSEPVLPEDSWDPDVRRSLISLIKEYGNKSKTYDENCRPYAVFDFDNTSIIGDISNNLMTYQVEHLIFGPGNIADGFLTGIPDTTVRFEDSGFTARELSEVLVRDWGVLKAKQSSGMPLEEIHKTPEYLEFRAAFMDLYEGVCSGFEYGAQCLWMPALLSGMPQEEARALVRKSTEARLADGVHKLEKWVSPDGDFRAEAPLGIVITPEMRHLFEALEANGIDIYICSASLEFFVETLACDPEIGFGLDPEKVYGLRFTDGDTVVPIWEEGYIKTWKEGKVECIRSLIAPLHCGREPILVGGDSNGDVAMLTAFPEMRHGLIWDRGGQGEIAALASRARQEHNRGIYLVD